MSETYSIPKIGRDQEQSRESQNQRNHNDNSNRGRQQSGKLHTPLIPFALELGFLRVCSGGCCAGCFIRCTLQ